MAHSPSSSRIAPKEAKMAAQRGDDFDSARREVQDWLVGNGAIVVAIILLAIILAFVIGSA